jgi:uncharacterized protein with GYD domain
MATFITTIKYSQQGIKGISETTIRAAAVKASAKKMGVKVTDTYWTLGDHDGLLDAVECGQRSAHLVQIPAVSDLCHVFRTNEPATVFFVFER